MVSCSGQTSIYFMNEIDIYEYTVSPLISVQYLFYGWQIKLDASHLYVSQNSGAIFIFAHVLWFYSCYVYQTTANEKKGQRSKGNKPSMAK